MKNLEEKIIKKVYFFETKNILMKLVFFLLLLIVGIFFGLAIYWQLSEQRAWDMLQIFQEDISVIREYLNQVMADIFQETPKIPLFFFVLFIFFLVFFLLIFIRNFRKLKKKTQSIIKFWTHL